MSCGAGRRCSLDLFLLWLWHRLAAVTSIQPLAWELPYTTGAALKRKKKKKLKLKKSKNYMFNPIDAEKALDKTR